jgi:hypothetical protein
LSGADFLHHEVPSEAARRLDNDGLDAVAGNACQKRREARTRVNSIGATHGRVSEPVNHIEAGALGVAFDCEPLPTLGVLALARIGRARRSQIADRLFSPERLQKRQKVLARAPSTRDPQQKSLSLVRSPDRRAR